MIDRSISSGVLAILSGTSGTLIALLKPWQEHIEWSLRIFLLFASIASVLVGLWITTRNKKPPST